MFKKLKDRIEEGVKQSPLKLTTSVQQFTQAVSSVSPSSSFQDNLPQSLEDDNENEGQKQETTADVTSASCYDSSFTNVDLRSTATLSASRLSFSSSITNDLFSMYEFPSNRYVVQSDLESCSEFDDSGSIQQFSNVTKEILYEKYRNMLQKYHKYRGRFVDVRKYCQELQQEHNKAKNILTEIQDKAIRRIAELKEQCSLEQKAKAHLEDALRNELEEKDHIINTLNTKLKLLKHGKNCDGELLATFISADEVKNSEIKTDSDVSESEVQILKDKIKTFENLLSKAKDAITSKNEQIKNFEKKMETEKDKQKALRDCIIELRNNIDLMKQKEENALLSLAENKLQIHQELETKEVHIKGLEKQITKLKEEIKKFKNDIETDAKNSKQKHEILQEEIKKLKHNDQINQKAIAEKDRLLNEFESVVDSSNEELMKLKNDIKSSKLISKSGNLMNADLESELTDMINHSESLESNLAKKQKEYEHLVNQLKDDKNTLETKLASVQKVLTITTNDHQEKSDLCNSLQNQLTSLKEFLKKTEIELNKTKDLLNEKTREVQHLEDYITITNSRLADIENEKKSWTDIEKHLKADKIVLEETLKSVKAELIVVKNELVNAKNAIARFENEKETLDKVKSELDRKKNIETVMLEKNSQLIEQIYRLKIAEDDYQKQIEDLNSQNDSLKRRGENSEHLTREIVEIRREKENVEKELETIRSELELKNEQLKDITKKNQNSFNDIVELKKEIELSNKEFNNIRSELELKENQLKELTAKFDDAKSELQLKNDRIKEVTANNEIMIKNIKRLQNELDESKSSYRETNNDLKSECQTLIQKVHELEKLVENGKRIQSENETLRNDCLSLGQKMSEMKEIFLTENEKVTSEMKKVLHNISNTSEEAENLRIENNTLKSKCSSMERLFAEMKTGSLEKCDRLNKQLENFYESNSDLSNEMETVEKQFRERTATNEDLQKKLQISDGKYVNIQDSHALIQQLLNNCRLYSEAFEDVTQFVEELKIVYECYSKLKDANSNLRCENQKLHSEQTKLNLKIQTKNDEINSLNIKVTQSVTENTILMLKDRASSLRDDFKFFKNELICDLHSLKVYCDEFCVKIRNGPTKAIQSHIDNYLQLESKLLRLQAEYNDSKSENARLVDENMSLEKRIHVFPFPDEDENKNRYQDEAQKLKDEYLRKTKYNITDFKKQLAQKDKENFELQKTSEAQYSVVLRDTKEIVRDLEQELNMKHDVYEKLLETQHDIESSSVEKPTVQGLQGVATQMENSEGLKHQIQLLSSELDNSMESRLNEDHVETNLEDFTELEYLRNILFEYMMGRQSMVLAKVLAAVVKFDENQTRQVLQREEQKLSLIGGLELRIT